FGMQQLYLHFTRDKRFCNSRYLRFVVMNLVHSIRTGTYVVTTPRTIQAIQNAFSYEFMRISRLEESAGEGDATSRKRLRKQIADKRETINHLRTILDLLDRKFLMIFDEIDLLMDPTKSYDFGCGEQQRIEAVTIEFIKEFFKVFMTHKERLFKRGFVHTK